tara:strand:- start:60 stop:257 length:198 start_codon:yes stop_codon:yes gene_type:complete
MKKTESAIYEIIEATMPTDMRLIEFELENTYKMTRKKIEYESMRSVKSLIAKGKIEILEGHLWTV